jgi:hypothetical protein
MVDATQREKMIDTVQAIMESKSMRMELEEHRFPKPREFATEIVDFFYSLAKEESGGSVQEAK